MYPEESERLEIRRRLLKKIGIAEGRKSIYSRIGFKGLFDVVYHSSPKLFFPLSVPYGLKVYKGILKGSANLEEVLRKHEDRYIDSRKFRLLRPRFRKARAVLKEKYGID